MVIIKGSNITVNSNNCTFNFTESDYVNGTIEQDMFLVDIGMNSIRDNINIKKLKEIIEFFFFYIIDSKYLLIERK